MTLSHLRRASRLSLLALVVVPLWACAVNPATGQREFSLVSEGQEIAMGREADPSIVAQMGLYPDTAVQRYVSDLGLALAARSERPDLPWTFRVLDDPAVNAFALPGGYIYITRGILSHLTSEAQLAGILGHEIGHVTARHGANRMSRAQLATLGLGIGAALSERVASLAGVASQGLGLLFLRFGRDDEYEADELGLRYMTRLGYDPSEMASVMTMLDRTSQLSGGGGRVPEWLSTHPNPGNRVGRIGEQVAATPEWASADRVERASFIRRLDGMPFGTNPRNGFTRDGVFHHPDLRIRLSAPAGWSVANGAQAVQMAPEDGSAVVELSLSRETPEAAASAFAASEGVSAGVRQSARVGGFPAVILPFTAQGQDGSLAGEMTWVQDGERTYRLMALSTSQGWEAQQSVMRSSVRSLARETDPEILGIEPLRVQVRTLQNPTPWSVFLQRYPSEVDDLVLGIINQVEVGAALQSGPVKQVTRGG